MGTDKRPAERNLVLEWVKLGLAALLMFIHVSLHTVPGEFMDCLARITVPTFFAISGYFSFQIDDRKIARRMAHIIKLMVIATVLFAAWGIWKIETLEHGSTMAFLAKQIRLGTIAQFLILGVNPFGGHLWYLTAVLGCYGCLWLFVRFRGEEPGSIDYRWAYLAGFLLFMVQVAAGSVATAVGSMDIPYLFYRNAWFFGIPMFCLGLFLREHQERLIRRFSLTPRRLGLLLLLGLVLSQIQWFGTGRVEMPLGTVLEVAALLLLTAPLRGTSSPRWTILSLLAGKASMVVYIVHMLIIGILSTYVASPWSMHDPGKILLWYLAAIGLSVLTGFAVSAGLYGSGLAKRRTEERESGKEKTHER